VRALRLEQWKAEATLSEVPEPDPGPGQVVIKVGAAGACHSDLHLMHEFEPGVLPWNPPFTLGHENAGWVHALGAGVRGLEVGQPVAVYGPWGCGRCGQCSVGAETYCEHPELAPVPVGGGGLGLDGGFAPYMLVHDQRFLLPLPDGLDPVQAAPLTDAGLTPYHAVRRSWHKLPPGSHAVVIGVGGLGHLAVQILKATTAAHVTAVDVRADALALATTCGADATVLSGPEAAEQVIEATKGRRASLVLDFVGNDATMSLAAAVVRALGDVTVVGIAGGTIPWSFFAMPYEASLQTTYWGSRPELAEVLQLAAAGSLKATITTFALDDAMDAYRQMQAGTLNGRAVILPGGGG
jgi:propanol-preferring alcohol dehydrogenase